MKLAQILGLYSVTAITKCTSPATAAYQQHTSPVAVSRTELDNFHRSYGFRLSPNLDERQRYQALEVLYRHKSAFARDLIEIKQCQAEPLKVVVHTNRQMFKRQYRLS